MFESFVAEKEAARREGRPMPKFEYVIKRKDERERLFKGTCSPAIDNSVPRGDRDDGDDEWN